MNNDQVEDFLKQFRKEAINVLVEMTLRIDSLEEALPNRLQMGEQTLKDIRDRRRQSETEKTRIFDRYNERLPQV